jgi:hypothetical protein
LGEFTLTAEPKSIHMQIEADTRLAAAAGAAARYFGDMAGMEGSAIAHLQQAVINACREAFALLTNEHPWLQVTLTRLADRIEVALCNESLARAAGQGNNRSSSLGGVDDINYETRGELTIMRLTKYISPTTLRY